VRLNDKALTIVTGLVLLLGVGAVIHKGDDMFAPKKTTTQVTQADIKPTVMTDAPAMNTYVAPARPDDTSGFSDFILVSSALASTARAQPETQSILKLDPIPLNCSLKLSAKPLRGARVELEISAPCHQGKVVTISHAGLRFNEIVGDKGTITIIIPVLSDPANIEVSFSDGIKKSISAHVKDLSLLQRTGASWSAKVGLQLHVYETSFNASRNAEVSTRNARSYKQAYLQGGGYLTTLGNKDIEGGKIVQIYSIENPNDIFVDFKLVMKNPAAHCGADFSLETVRYATELGTQLADKNISIRNCSANTQTIVLKNMFRNLIVAQRN